jgi:biopolymer transport protein ExbD
MAEGSKSTLKLSKTGEAPVWINMTPMMDALTSLLFFLMANMAAQSAAIEGVESLSLPGSTSNKDMVITLKVTASLDTIKVEDSPVVVLKNGDLSAKYLEESKIIPLYNSMVRLLEQKKAKGLDVKLDDSIVFLLADKRLKSDLIAKIMKTCGMAGIPNFHFGVIRI